MVQSGARANGRQPTMTAKAETSLDSMNIAEDGEERLEYERIRPRRPRAIQRHIARQLQFLHGSSIRFAIQGLNCDDNPIARRAFSAGERAEAIVHAASLSGRVEAVWISLGELDKAHPLTKPVKDQDVTRRKGIAIDIDVVKPPNAEKRSSTQAEHLAARERGVEVAEYLIKIWGAISDEQRFPYPVFNDSGNGAHILIPADLPNDDAARDLIRDFLHALARRFPTDGITKIDTTVFNAGRWIKLAGTWARKGPPTRECPHRIIDWARMRDSRKSASASSV